jgi:hypothetical protein
MQMTMDELKKKLMQIFIIHQNDPEAAHWEADKVVLEYINDPNLTNQYMRIGYGDVGDIDPRTAEDS